MFDAIEERWLESPVVFDRIFGFDASWILALIEEGDANRALAKATKAHEYFSELLGESSTAAAESLGLMAIALDTTGRRDQSADAFERSIPILVDIMLERQVTSANSTVQKIRIVRILEHFIDFLTREAEPNSAANRGIDEALRIADAARWSSVQSSMSANRARAARQDPELTELIRVEQDLALRHGAILQRILINRLSASSQERIRGIQDEVGKLAAARNRILGEIETRFPNYSNLMSPEPASVQEIKALLRRDEALISTYVAEDRTYVWAIPREGRVAFAIVPRGRDDIGFDVAYLRGALDAKAATLGAIPVFDVEVAHGLYKSLLEPVKTGWRAAKSLLIVAHGPLGQLPFSLLPTARVELAPDIELLFANYRKVPWLARTHATTVLPSVASLVTLRSTPPGDLARRAFAGFGDPLFSPAQANAATSEAIQTTALENPGILSVRGLPIRLRSLPQTENIDSAELAQLPRLRDTADEIESIALALDADLTQDVFIGKAANESQVKTMDLSDRKVIVFATHGLVPGDLNGLTQPALALSSPAVVGGEDDGVLTMGEILGLRLDADWVVLSACNTASGDGAGAEAVSGLGRAFFYAGARALLVSNWPVHSQSAKDLTTDVFRRQAAGAALSRAVALQKAMVHMIVGGTYADPSTGSALFSYAHPIFWAPFTLIGDGGGARPSS